MTTGTWVAGSTATDFYARKTWSGSDTPQDKTTFNAYKMSHLRVRRTQTVQYNNGSFLRQNYLYNATRTTVAAWGSNDTLQLLSKLKTKMQGHGFNAAIAGAEFRETVSTLANVSSAVLRLVGNVMTGNVGGALRALGALPGQVRYFRPPGYSLRRSRLARDQGAGPSPGYPPVLRWLRHPRRIPRKRVTTFARKLTAGDISGAWLALQYGLMPFFDDVSECATMLENWSSGPRSLVVKASHTIYEKWEASSMPTQTSIIGRGFRKKKLTVTMLEEVAISRQLGLHDWWSVLWERTPFSFVIDWFIPIGTYLDALSMFAFKDYRADEVEYAEAKLALVTPMPATGSITYVGGSYQAESHELVRRPSVLLAVPRPSFKTMEEAFSLPHLKNAAALVFSAVRSASIARLKSGHP